MSVFADLILLRPAALLLLPLLPVLLWWQARRRDRPEDWQRLCDPELQPAVLTRTDTTAAGWGRWLACLAWALACIALAGPAWDRQPLPLAQRDAARVLVVDLSPAMRAADIAPSRMARARMKLHDLLDRLPPGQTGLVVFADDAFVAAPLTDDVNTLRGYVDALDPGLMPVPGQRAERGLEQGARLLRQAGLDAGDLLLLSSGEVGPELPVAAAQLAREGIRTAVWLMASPEGGALLDPDGSLLRLRDGRLRLSRPDLETLAVVARTGAGRLEPFDPADRDLDGLLDWLDQGRLRDGAPWAAAEHWQDRAVWLVLLVLPLAALAFRRGVLFAWPLAVLLLAPAPAAAGWRDWFEPADRRAARALADGDAAGAAAIARDPEWRGAAAFRLGDYDAAVAAFAAAQASPRALYNLGNALAARGDHQAAIEAWERVLVEDPGHEDARANLEALRDWLEQQAPRQDPGEAPAAHASEDRGTGDPGEHHAQDGAGPPGAASRGDDQRQASPHADGGAEPSAPSEDQGGRDAHESEALARALREAIDAAAEQTDAFGASVPDPAAPDEEREALERWLRRVPDDPGGLLRAKFQLEHQRRLREGRDGASR